jgi:hypothetical protein
MMKILKEAAPFFLLIAAILFVRVAVGESPVTWTTGTYEGTPAGSDLASTIDNNIRELKSTIRDYAESELCWGDGSSTGCTTGNDGQLREGATRVFAEDSAPANLNMANRTGNSLDQGRLWVDTNTSPDNHLQVYNGGWEDVDGVPATDRTNWNAVDTQVDEHLVAVKATRTADVTIEAGPDTSCQAEVILAWNSETGGFDDATLHDTVTNNSRLEVPDNATRVKVSANLVFLHSSGSSADLLATAYIKKTGATPYVAGQTYFNTGLEPVANVKPNINFDAIVDATTSDYFEIAVIVCYTETGNFQLESDGSWFALEVIQ